MFLLCLEGPIISFSINRLPDEILMLGAMGIVISLAMTIESPIINLLSTSTALVRDRSSYLLVRRFTLHWSAFLTLLSILLAFTPLFDLIVIRWMNAPPEVARWIKPGLRIMTLWSACIAWRRFLQGILIRYGQTQKVAWGTAVRLASIGGTIIGLSLWGRWPSVMVGATALMAGVLFEAIYATLVTRPICQKEFGPDRPLADGPPLTYRELFWFHLPLAGTSVLYLLAQPLVSLSLARLDLPTQSLAAWPVLSHISLISRSPAFALRETLIPLFKRPGATEPLRRFSLKVMGVMTLLMALFLMTPLSQFYVFVVQDLSPTVAGLVTSNIVLFLFYPGFCVAISFLQGMFITSMDTKGVTWGMGINLLVTAAVLGIALAWRLPGLPSAAIALNLALIMETLYLLFRARGILPPGKRLF